MAKEQYVPLRAGVAAVLDETAPVEKEEALLEWVAKQMKANPPQGEETA